MTDIIQKLEHRLHNQPYGCIITRSEMPELIEVAPLVAERYKVGRFTIQRAKVDQLDQFTVSRGLPARIACPFCGKEISSRASFCVYCDNDL